MKDKRRRPSAPGDRLQYSFKEEGSFPKKRTYDEYVASATIVATSSNVTSDDGVKGLWVMHRLPYAHLIRKGVDPMHTMNGFISDTLNSLRPSTNGRYMKHSNRMLSANVLEACKSENIFQDLVDGETSCIFTTDECCEADEYDKYVVGTCSSRQLPKSVLKKGKARNSHDTIYWATTWARWCLRGKGSKDHVDNLCQIFDIIGVLNSSHLHMKQVRNELYPELISAIVTRSGLVPPSEATIVQHELVHVCSQVWDQGLPRMSTLYKFERINLFLKKLLKNKAAGNNDIVFNVFNLMCVMSLLFTAGLASIMKNYLIHEISTMNFSLYHDNMAMLYNVAKYQPSETSVFDDMSGYLDNVHIEQCGGAPVIYDVPSCFFTELRGHPRELGLSFDFFNFLLMESVDFFEELSALYFLHKRYEEYRQEHSRMFSKQFLLFIEYVVTDDYEMGHLHECFQSLHPLVRTKAENDIEIIRKALQAFDRNEKFSIRSEHNIFSVVIELKRIISIHQNI